MSRFARLGVWALALAAAGITAASGAAAAGGEKEGREKRQLRHVERAGGGYLGVQLQEVTPDDLARLKLDEERGALVREVVEGSPAAHAGLKEGDVILRYQGEPVRSAAQLARLVAETPTGRTVSLELSRDGAAQKLSVALGERKARSWLRGMPDFALELPEPPEPPDAPAAPDAPEAPEAPEPPSRWTDELLGRDWAQGFHFGWGGPRKLGISYQEISGQLAGYFKLSADAGVLVTEVDEDGPAAKAGLKAGDVILAFDGKEVRDGDDLRRGVRDADAGRALALKVQREGRALDLNVTLAEHDRERERARRRAAGI
jgi:membrane-associated protease RseP (regulator of RpoE activity)